MANRFLNNITINDAYTFPSTDGSDGQAIITDGAGNLSFGSVAAASADSSESTHLNVKNTSGSLIAKGTPVYITGNVGNTDKLEIAPADASSASTMPAVGLLETDLANDGEGFVVQGGFLKGLVTATIDGTSTSSNDTVYVKSGGGLTMTKPTGASNFIQNIAKVARVHASNGSLVVSSILRANDVPNLPEGKIWVGDGNTTVSTIVHLDELNSNVGINTITPSVSLDISGTDAIQVPKGLTSDRPTPASGMFRFNTTTNEFEGYNGTEWAPIGGANAASIDVDSFTGDAVETAFTLSSAISEEVATQIYIDGVYQSKDNYSTSGTTLTFTDAPADGASIEVVHFTGISESDLNGSGTANYVTKWLDSDTLTDSVVYDDGTNVGIGCTPTSISGYTVLDINNSTNGAIIDLSQANAMKGRLVATSASMAIETASGIPISFQPSGTERMRIDSSGNVGIGTTSPQSQTHIYTVGTAGNNYYEGDLQVGGVSSLVGAKLNYASQNSGRVSLVNLNNSGGSASTIDLGFGAISTDGRPTNKAVTITQGGSVGIGTTSPNAELEVIGDIALGGTSAAPLLKAIKNGGAAYDNIIYYNNQVANNDLYLGRDSSNIILRTNTAERLRIDSSGVTTFTAENNTSGQRTSKFDSLIIKGIYSGGDGQPYTGFGGGIVFNNETYDGTFYDSAAIYGAIGDDSITTNAGGHLAFYTSTTKTAAPNEKMRIDSSGNVGIGEASPDNRIHIKGGTDATSSIKLEKSGSSIAILTSYYIGTTTSDDFRFLTNGTEKMRITSEGNVGINETNPSTAKLVIETGPTSGIDLYRSAVNAQFEAFRFRDSSNANTEASIGWNADQLRLNSTNNTVFTTGGTEKMRITSGGNVGIGVTVPPALLAIKKDVSTAYDATDDLGQRDGTATLHIENGNGSTNSFAQIVFDTADNGQAIARIVALRTGSSSNDMAFVVEGGNTKREAMRIDSSGNLHVLGDVIAASTTVSSDENLKKDISTYEDALQTISELNGVSFAWKSNDKKSVGVIAQDVQKVLPELVGTKKSLEGGEETLTVDYNGLIGVLIQAVKELSKQVEELKK